MRVTFIRLNTIQQATFLFIVVFTIMLYSSHMKNKINQKIIQTKQSSKMKSLREIYERKLSRLLDFPKAEQLEIMKQALVHRQELMKYLIERYNITENQTRTGTGKLASLVRHSDVSHGEAGVLSRRPIKYAINVKEKCYDKPPFVLIVVHSHWNNTNQRNHIRQTWASIASYNRLMIKTVFFLGTPASQPKGEDRPDLINEQRQFDDIVQGDFVDAYRNLTIKHLMVYHWILERCHRAAFIVKVDDDTIVNVFHLINFLKSADNLMSSEHAIYCSAFVNQGPRRDIQDKWYVSKTEYPHEKYPTYCEGFAYITTPVVVSMIYAQSLHTAEFWIDDVYVTGILAKAAGITHKQFRKPYGYTVIDGVVSARHLQTSLFFLQKYVKDFTVWTQTWQAILRGKKTGIFTIKRNFKHRISPLRAL